MTKTISAKSSQFIDSVLRLKPHLAAFDCDGTLWAGDAGEGFFDWELNQGLLADEIVRWARPRYADYKAGNVEEETMCGEMVTLHRGMKESVLEEAAQRFFEGTFTHNIFSEMHALVAELRAAGCEIWAVSSTNEWVIRAAMKHFAIDENKVLAAAVEIRNGIVSDKLIRVPSGDGKPRAIREFVGRTPDVAFGNSRWDMEMLEMAGAAFAVNPNPDLKQIATARGWNLFQPDIPAAG